MLVALHHSGAQLAAVVPLLAAEAFSLYAGIPVVACQGSPRPYELAKHLERHITPPGMHLWARKMQFWHKQDHHLSQACFVVRHRAETQRSSL